MKLAQLMTRDVEVVSPEDSLSEAARRMAERGVGVLPVCDDGRLVGVITDRDLVVRSMARGQEPNRVRVAEAMTYEVRWCFEDHSLREVGRRMQDRQVRRIVVLDRKKNLVGIISLGDLALAKGNGPLVARTLEEVCRPLKASIRRPPPRGLLPTARARARTVRPSAVARRKHAAVRRAPPQP